MSKEAITKFPVHPLIRQRWSPRAFADRSIEKEALGSLFEAARWAPSSFGEQPWSFIVARREDQSDFGRILRCLVPWNQVWAQHAPVLMISLARTYFERNGQPNRHAFHDLGLAVAQLTFQATAIGLAVHQMAGIDLDGIRANFSIPDGTEPVTAIAVGYIGDPGILPERLREREGAVRERKSLASMVIPSSILESL
jgi:nitroreductase